MIKPLLLATRKIKTAIHIFFLYRFMTKVLPSTKKSKISRKNSPSVVPFSFFNIMWYSEYYNSLLMGNILEHNLAWGKQYWKSRSSFPPSILKR